MLGVARGVNECHIAGARFVLELIEHTSRLDRAELRAIACGELAETRRRMREPAAELVARSDFLRPPIERELLPLLSAWPEPVDENAQSVLRSGRIVCALDADHARCASKRDAALRSELARCARLAHALRAGRSGVDSPRRRSTAINAKGRDLEDTIATIVVE
jgi:hypothetical protein